MALPTHAGLRCQRVCTALYKDNKSPSNHRPQRAAATPGLGNEYDVGIRMTKVVHCSTSQPVVLPKPIRAKLGLHLLCRS